jgi:hypothetical protein
MTWETKMNKLFIALTLYTISLTSQAFTLVGSDIATYGEPAITVNVGSQACTNVTDGPEDLLSLISEANEKFWNSIATSEVELLVGSAQNVAASFYTDQICNTGAGCVPAVSSGILILCNDNGTTFNFGGKLAVTLPNNISGNTIVGSIIAINDTATSAFINLTRDEKISVIAHEIGHAIGLGHSKFQDSLMYAENLSGRVALGQDDWDGATFLYPKEQGALAVCGTIDTGSNEDSGKYMLSLLALMLIFLVGNQRLKAKKDFF